MKRRQLADASWTGDYSYDAAGRLFAIDNAATASASQPGFFIDSVTYTARGQTDLITYGNGATASFTYDSSAAGSTGC